eukprot:621562_1
MALNDPNKDLMQLLQVQLAKLVETERSVDDPKVSATHKEAIVYWDYDNTHMTIPNGYTLKDTIEVIKTNICNKIGSQPIQFQLYTSIKPLQLSPKQKVLFANGIEHIHIETKDAKHMNSSKTKLRMSIDIGLKLFELQQNKESKCIVLISNDDDFGHLLSRIHKQSPVSHLIYVAFNQINTRLTNHVDFVIRCFNEHSPIKSPNTTNTVGNVKLNKRKHLVYDDDCELSPSPKRQKTAVIAANDDHNTWWNKEIAYTVQQCKYYSRRKHKYLRIGRRKGRQITDIKSDHEYKTLEREYCNYRYLSKKQIRDAKSKTVGISSQMPALERDII